MLKYDIMDILNRAANIPLHISKEVVKQISSKSITLSNIRLQSDALKGNQKRQIKRQRGQIVSNKLLKSINKSFETDNNNKISIKDAEILHKIWKEYILEFLKSCRNESQIQSRLSKQSIELIGAKVNVTDFHTNEEIVRGIITNTTTGMFYITKINDTNDNDDEIITLETPVRIVLDENIVTIEVPSSMNNTVTESNTTNNSNTNNNSKSYEFVILPDDQVVSKRKYKYNNKVRNKRKRFKEWQQDNISTSTNIS